MTRPALAVLLAAALFATAHSSPAIDLAAIQQRNLEVTTLEGDTIPLAQVLAENKPLIVEFWATWCSPCRKLSPVYEELSRTHAQDSLVVVGLSIESDRETVAKYCREQGVTHPVALGAGEVYKAFNPGREQVTVPRAFFFDRDGRLVEQINGMSMFGAKGKIKSAAAKITKPRASP